MRHSQVPNELQRRPRPMQIHPGYRPNCSSLPRSWPPVGTRTCFLRSKPPQNLFRLLNCCNSITLRIGCLRCRRTRWVRRPLSAHRPTRKAALRQGFRRSLARGGGGSRRSRHPRCRPHRSYCRLRMSAAPPNCNPPSMADRFTLRAKLAGKQEGLNVMIELLYTKDVHPRFP